MAKLFIEDLQLPGKRVLMRVDLNVPVKDGKVENDRRLLPDRRGTKGQVRHRPRRTIVRRDEEGTR
jgi:3-phosphoglycerate kinase